MADDQNFELLDGIDAPRPLPDDLRASLLGVRADLEAAAALEAASAPQPLPDDLRDRLVAIGASGLPRALRRRLLRRAGVPSILNGPAWMQAAAVVVVVLLVAGGVALASEGRRTSTPPDVAAPATTTTTSPPETTTTTAAPPAPPTTAAPKPKPKRVPPKPKEALLAVSTCDELLGVFKAAALARVGAYGLAGTAVGTTTAGTPAPATAAPPTTGAPAPSSEPASPEPAPTAEPGEEPLEPSFADSSPHSPDDEYSVTNIQEAGVDEPDRVKTDGKRIFALVSPPGGSQRKLQSLRIDADGPKLVASTPMPAGDFQLLLAGNRLIALGRDYGGPADGTRARTGYWTSVLTYDVTDLAAPALLHARFIDGHYVNARLASGALRVVVHTTNVQPAFVWPQNNTPEAQQQAIEQNKSIVQHSTIDDWMPRMVSERRAGGPPSATSSKLCECDDTLRPPDFSGFSALNVVTLDPSAPDTADVASVQGGGQTVYASPSALYVTTSPWLLAQSVLPDSSATPSVVSSIHRFSIEGTKPAVYEASGAVPGHVLNQFSMSEHDGHLRVATTTSTPDGSSESLVTVLLRNGPALQVVGQVGGLGKGERIYAVRFIGPVGYVVTFRQVDPLYVVDLADPTKPKVAGELKINGYSAYLHPIRDGYLMGIGQDATDSGRRTGTQVSIFDVRNPAAPARTHQQTLGEGSMSDAEADHHAFLYWARTGATVVPIYDAAGAGAVVLSAAPDRLEVKGRISHAEYAGADPRTTPVPILRSLVIGGSLYTLSHQGLLRNDLETLAGVGWVQF